MDNPQIVFDELSNIYLNSVTKNNIIFSTRNYLDDNADTFSVFVSDYQKERIFQALVPLYEYGVICALQDLCKLTKVDIKPHYFADKSKRDEIRILCDQYYNEYVRLIRENVTSCTERIVKAYLETGNINLKDDSVFLSICDQIFNVLILDLSTPSLLTSLMCGTVRSIGIIETWSMAGLTRKTISISRGFPDKYTAMAIEQGYVHLYHMYDTEIDGKLIKSLGIPMFNNVVLSYDNYEAYKKKDDIKNWLLKYLGK